MELINALKNGGTIKALRMFTDKGRNSERTFFRNSKYVIAGEIGQLAVLRNTLTNEEFPLNPAILTAENFTVVVNA